jgi:hypothetical protein
MIKKVKKIDKKELANKKTLLETDKDVESTIDKKKNQYYDTLWSGIVFEKKEQKEGGFKLLAKLPSGKFIFLDKGENKNQIKIDVPYICLIYEPVNSKTGKEMSVAFAKVVCEESIPKILVHPEGAVYLIYKNNKGEFKKEMIASKTYAFRITEAVKKMESLGFEDVRIIFMKNKAKEAKKVNSE